LVKWIKSKEKMRRLRMRAKFILPALVLFMASGLLWAQFWKDYSDSERKTMGEAYWLAGQQYETVGKTEKGREYQAVAKAIYPQLDPSAIAEQSQLSAAELLAQGRTTTIGGGASAVPTGALNSFFLRFVGALVDQDAAGVAGFLDGSIYLTKIPKEVTRDEARTGLAETFKESPLKGKEPSAVYDLDSIVIAREGPAMQKAWGESYTLAISAREDFSAVASIWDMKQQFFIRRSEGNWYIFAYGQASPPLTWSPQSSAPAAAVPPAASTEVEETKAVTDTFNSFLEALLKKDADGAAGYMQDNVRLLKLDQTVTREELKTSLQGYFDSASFTSETPADVVEADSVFVEPAASPVEGVEGTVYVLNARAKIDLSASLPFWSTYQRYYFAKDGNDWKIFALLL
jgi:hypothetical protein